MVELLPSKKLPSRERVARILNARWIAKRRFRSCSAQVAAGGGAASSLQDLGSAWTSKEGSMGAAALMKDSDAQDGTVKLIFDTEVQTNEVCGAPSGDDALLLLLARSPQALEE
jgi:hypothetical protein